MMHGQQNIKFCDCQKVFPDSHLEELLHVVYISQTKPSYCYITRYNLNLMPKTNYTLIEKRDDINVDVT
jgi:hypothetical protein